MKLQPFGPIEQALISESLTPPSQSISYRFWLGLGVGMLIVGVVWIATNQKKLYKNKEERTQ